MFLHNLLNVLVQIANKMGLQKKYHERSTFHASTEQVYPAVKREVSLWDKLG
jgi:hypothetical protein